MHVWPMMTKQFSGSGASSGPRNKLICNQLNKHNSGMLVTLQTTSNSGHSKHFLNPIKAWSNLSNGLVIFNNLHLHLHLHRATPVHQCNLLELQAHILLRLRLHLHRLRNLNTSTKHKHKHSNTHPSTNNNIYQNNNQ